MTNFPEIHPLNASPEIAAIYADIRAVSGLSMVNLIWRHFAALPGIIEWAWKGVRPLVASQELVDARRRLIDAIALPTLPSVTLQAWQAAGVGGAELTAFRDMMADYVRGNSTNIIVLTALRLRLEGINHATPAYSAAPTPVSMTPSAPLPRIDSLDPKLARAVRALAQRHEGAQGGIIPSLYLELARWPALTDTFAHWLEALYEPSAMRAARASTCLAAEREALTLLPAFGPAPPNVAEMRPALERFTRLIIPDLTPVCVAVQRLLPER
jgi:phage tail protein X